MEAGYRKALDENEDGKVVKWRSGRGGKGRKSVGDKSAT